MSRGRIPPHNLEAERSLIGAALIRPAILHDMAAHVDPSDFYAPDHQTVWATVLELHDRGQPIDVVTVGEATSGRIADGLLFDCFNATPAVSAASRYAEIVVEASRRRKLMHHLASLSDRLYDEDADSVLADLEPDQGALVRDPSRSVDGLSRLDEFLAVARSHTDVRDWLIPHTLKPRWRQVFVAGEGVGKATLLRFLGLHVASGRNPWNPTQWIVPRRVLNVDVENSDETIAHQIGLANVDRRVEAEAADHFFVWHREGGINLRDRRQRAEFERVLQQTRPEILIAGPLYKMFRRGRGEDQEEATIEFLQLIDDFRVRFDMAILLEHHAPHGQGGHRREMRAAGSSALMRWPEHGIGLEIGGNPLPDDQFMEINVTRFRLDRIPMNFPTKLYRGKSTQSTAWQGHWPNGIYNERWPRPEQETLAL